VQKHLLRGSQFDRSTLRREFEQLHQAWPSSGVARFGATTPTSIHPRGFGSIQPKFATIWSIRGLMESVEGPPERRGSP
jgi:hypothetical protein